MNKLRFLIVCSAIFINTYTLHAQTEAEAIEKIVLYAEAEDQPPLLSDYLDAGIINIHEANLDGVNEEIRNLGYRDVDTQGEIQLVVDEYNRMIAAFLSIVTQHILSSPTAQEMAIGTIMAYADDNTSTAPTVTDYETAGVTGVTDANLNAINDLVAATTSDAVDTTEEIQAIVDSVLALDTVPPVITSENNLTIIENSTVVTTITAEDNSMVTFGISGGDDGALFSIDTQNGVLSFVNEPNFERPQDSDTNNIYLVEINATDAAANSVVQLITVTVLDDTTSADPIDMDIANTIRRLGTPLNLDVKVDLGSTSHTLYILLTNYSQSDVASVTIDHNAKVVATDALTTNITKLSSRKRTKNRGIRRAPEHVTQFNHDAINKLRPSLFYQRNQKVTDSTTLFSMSYVVRNDRVEGDTGTFDIESDTSVTTDATLKKIVSNVTTAFGTKTLNIWVSNDTFDDGSGCAKTTCITQDLVDTLATKFLQDGDNNDIYDWVTNVYGEEWGADASVKYTNLIGESDEINILLTDIDNDDSPNGGTVGYFYAKDNYTKEYYSGSNEMIMFYIDSVMYANTEFGDYWQKQIYATLAHEFQHMINFYQSSVLNDVMMDTWLNEMLSETTEDLIATKLQVDGPRAVSYLDGSAGDPGNTDGRYPDFNINNTRTLPVWLNDLAEYSKVSAFGAFLIRNYGGAEVLHNIMYGTDGNTTAVVNAVNAISGVDGKTFGDILREWGIGVLLSDVITLDDTTPRYNVGEFIYKDYNNITYDLGSINFFNYDPLPLLNNTAGDVNPEANYYYLVGEGLTGVIDINLTLNGTTEATLIVK